MPRRISGTVSRLQLSPLQGIDIVKCASCNTTTL
ncbi:hypothetical protein FCV43_14675 [Vibrio genomosp. F6]|nr:hypothetical protein FCV43_14675 [Vibrio genomosp. F6]